MGISVGQIFIELGLTTVGFGKGENAIKRIGNMARAYIGGQAVSGLIHMAEEAGKAGTEILAMSKQLGISTDAMQSWQYVAKTSGSNAREFSVAISQIERGLLQLSHGKGSKEARAAFLDLGISQAEAAKLLTKPDGLNEALFKISDRAKAMGNDIKRASEIQLLSGRRARGFAADMAQGSAALREQIAHVHAIGGVLSHGQLTELKVFSNSMNDLKTSFHALVMQAVAQLAPAMTKALNSLTKWIGENREMITQTLLTAFHALIGAMKIFAQIVGFAAKHTEILKGLLLAVAAIKLGGLISSLAEMVAKLIGARAAAVGTKGALGGLGGGLGGVAGQVGIIAAGIWGWSTAISAARELASEFSAKEIGHGLKDWVSGRSAESRSDQNSLEKGEALGDKLWAEHKASQAARNAASNAAPVGQHFTKPGATGGNKTTNIHIEAPVTINGVKDAASASKEIQEAADRAHRHAAAAMGQ